MRDRATNRRGVAPALTIAMLAGLASVVGAGSPVDASIGGGATAQAVDIELLSITDVFGGIDLTSPLVAAPSGPANGTVTDNTIGASPLEVTIGVISNSATRDATSTSATSSIANVSIDLLGLPLLRTGVIDSSVTCPYAGAPTATATTADVVVLGAAVTVTGVDVTINASVPLVADITATIREIEQTTPTGQATAIVLTVTIDPVALPPVVVGDIVLADTTCEPPTTPDPTITSLVPTSGPAAGGTLVTVTGTDFVPGGTSVIIGADTVPDGSVNVTSPTTLTFITPGDPPGPVDVTVTTAGGTSTALPFTYLAAPTPPNASAGFTGPSPNPVPAGSGATASVDFSVASDVGPVTVSVELLNSGGSGTLTFESASAALTSCAGTGTTLLTCEWDGDSADSPQTISFTVDVAAGTAPNQGWALVAAAESLADSGGRQNLAFAEIGIAPPIGSTTLSGQVISTGGIGVPQACIFLLSTRYVFMAITADDGTWSLSGLPDDYVFAVAAIPPFTGTFGPCANDGPPPVPSDGELQPVFFDNIWIDLSDPALTGGQSDPYAFAVSAGATSIADSRAGIISCLTTAAGDVVPRPACLQVPTTTTTTTTALSTTTTTPSATTSTAAASARTTSPGGGRLPATGSTSASILVIATLVTAVGAITLATRRHAPPNRRPPE